MTHNGQKLPFQFHLFTYDGAFSINTGLKPIGVVGPICWAGSLNNLQLTVKGLSDEGVPAGSLMAKLVSFLRKGKNSIVDGVILCTFCWWDYSMFIEDDHDDFPYWMMIRRSPH